MSGALIDRFGSEACCTYRGEDYLVRDNGAVLRLKKPGARHRQIDQIWMFGRPCDRSGYMHIASVPVHRVVATAFHGPAPSGSHVVDHIDTNRQNNRPDNLRWVTRLENILLNPITLRRIELAYGSLEKFFQNPQQPVHGPLEPNFDWMRTVSAEEAAQTLTRLSSWAGGRPIGDWVRTSRNLESEREPKPEPAIQSKTPSALQRNWKTPSEFPCCPAKVGERALHDYRAALHRRQVYAFNDFGESRVIEAELSEDQETLVVFCTCPGMMKDWALSKIVIEGGQFRHEGLGTFFTETGARKQFMLQRGLEWEGEDTIDDYC